MCACTREYSTLKYTYSRVLLMSIALESTALVITCTSDRVVLMSIHSRVYCKRDYMHSRVVIMSTVVANRE